MSAWEQNIGFMDPRPAEALDDEVAALEALRFAREDEESLVTAGFAGNRPPGDATTIGHVRASLATVPPSVSSVPAPVMPLPCGRSIESAQAGAMAALATTLRRPFGRRFAEMVARAAGPTWRVNWAVLVASIAIALPSGLLLGNGLSSHASHTLVAAAGARTDPPESTTTADPANPTANTAPAAGEATSPSALASATLIVGDGAEPSATLHPPRSASHTRRRPAAKAASNAGSASLEKTPGGEPPAATR